MGFPRAFLLAICIISASSVFITDVTSDGIVDDDPITMDLDLILSRPRRTLNQVGGFGGGGGGGFNIPGFLGPLLNPNLIASYFALQAWKQAITSDPKGITDTWVGFDVCKYEGVFCAPPPDNSCKLVVAGIDLNHANLAGTLPEKLGLLKYLAIFHINSNRFYGTLPESISKWSLLYELDVSNNLFEGPFPEVVLCLPSLAFLDIRFNRFSGYLPPALFEVKTLNAIFVNDNLFTGPIPENLGSSPVSVVVFARNSLAGGIPDSVSQMADTLVETIFLGNGLTGCVPGGFGELHELNVLDISFNNLSGVIPPSISRLRKVEQLNVADNLLSGPIPADICTLPKLQNFTASANFFTSVDAECAELPAKGGVFDVRQDCLGSGFPGQRSTQECSAFFATDQICPAPKPPPPPSPPPHAVPVRRPRPRN